MLITKVKENAVSLSRLMLSVLMFIPVAALAADVDMVLTIREHRFEPADVRVPAGKKIRLVVQNLDATPEEFESHELNREKVIPGKGQATVYIGPLKPGRYPFVGEFNEKTARGVVIAE